MKTLISIDPGICSAIAVFQYGENLPAKLTHIDQFRGGAEELLKRYIAVEDSMETEYDVICEDFQARPQTNFSYTTDSLEPLVCIGTLVAIGAIDRRNRNHVVTPVAQYFAGGSGKEDRKQRQHAWLKENGFYYTNKNFPDCLKTDGANDARSAIAHGLVWLRKRHIETAKHYFKE